MEAQDVAPPSPEPMDDDHQVYIVPYDTKQQLWKVLEVLKLHNKHAANPGKGTFENVRYNKHESYTRLEAGEELMGVELVAFRQGARKGPYASPSVGPALSRGVVFGNAAGSKKTFAFLQWHLLRAMPEVYVDGFPAMTVYACDDRVNLALISNRRQVSENRIYCAPSDEPRAEPVEPPAVWITRTTVANPEFHELMMDLDPDADRREIMRNNPEVPPYLSFYEETTVEC